MRIWKITSTMLLAVFVIFMISGCQKDTVSPQQMEVSKSGASTSKQKSIAVQSKNVSNKSTIKTKETDKKEETTTKKNATNSESTKNQVSQSTETKNKKNSTASTISKPKTNTNTSKTYNTQNNTKPITKVSEPQTTINISIISSDLKKTIIAPTKVSIHNGDTYLNVTRQILKQKGIPISVRGSGASAYVEGIGDLYEFDHGPLSGWKAKKNGVQLDRSVGIITVKDRDSIQWIYTTDYNKDKN